MRVAGTVAVIIWVDYKNVPWCKLYDKNILYSDVSN